VHSQPPESDALTRHPPPWRIVLNSELFEMPYAQDQVFIRAFDLGGLKNIGEMLVGNNYLPGRAFYPNVNYSA